MEEEYNGWENRETWAIKLHWDNNHGDYTFFTEEAKVWKQDGRSVGEFADRLKEIAEDIFHDVIMDGNGTHEARLLVSDVGSLWRVNWFEIAQAYFDEVDE